jgi:hypothetical protein
LIQLKKWGSSVINLTNNTLFLFLTRAMYFSRLKREKKKEKEITSLKLHRVFGGYTRRTTMKRTARRIEHRPKIWYLVIGRCRMHRPKGVGASHMLTRASFSLFPFYLGIANISRGKYYITLKACYKT